MVAASGEQPYEDVSDFIMQKRMEEEARHKAMPKPHIVRIVQDAHMDKLIAKSIVHYNKDRRVILFLQIGCILFLTGATLYFLWKLYSIKGA